MGFILLPLGVIGLAFMVNLLLILCLIFCPYICLRSPETIEMGSDSKYEGGRGDVVDIEV